jgi:hypothetical protein
MSLIEEAAPKQVRMAHLRDHLWQLQELTLHLNSLDPPGVGIVLSGTRRRKGPAAWNGLRLSRQGNDPVRYERLCFIPGSSST